MPTMTKSCYYRVRGRECQFGTEEAKLINVGEHWFCQYHLPWSPRDLRERFKINIGGIDPTRANLKNNWKNDAAQSFHSEVIGRLAEQDMDLSGFVAAGAFHISGKIIKKTVFADAFFPDDVSIASCVFDGAAEFSRGSFLGQARFHNVAFLQEADFSFATFEKLTIESSYFQLWCDFRNVSFEAPAVIRDNRFYCLADFSKVRFRDAADFSKCSFNDDANFADTTFESADFRDCTFRGAMLFDTAVFQGAAVFEGGAERAAAASFRSAQFGRDVSFERRNFTNGVDFHGARFAQAPRFADTVLPSVTFFPPLENFRDWKFRHSFARKWIVGIERRRMTKREYFQSAAVAYRVLRLKMSERGAQQDEAMFWELEMRATDRSFPWYSWPAKVPFKLYSWIAKYGNSVIRPLVWWLLLLIGFNLAYLEIQREFEVSANLSAAWPEWFERIRNAAEFSLRQTVWPFAVWSEEGARSIKNLIELSNDHDLLRVRLLATLQSVLSLAVIALFILALRRRFRMP